MRFKIFFLVVIFGRLLQAQLSPEIVQEIPFPILACERSQQCTDDMKSIAHAFMMASNTLLQRDLEAYSGACYHLSSLYDPSHMHHGAFAFRRVEGAWRGVGEFSFFAMENPHLGQNPAELYQSVSLSGSEFPVQKLESHVEVRFLEEDSDLRYWFRNSEDGNEVYVVGQQKIQSYLGTMYCRFQKH